MTGMNMAKNRQFFFFNLKKQRGSQNTIKKLVIDDKEITEQTHIPEQQRKLVIDDKEITEQTHIT